MKSKFKKLLAAALVLCLMLALLPVSALAEGEYFCEQDSNWSQYYHKGYEGVTVHPQKAYYSEGEQITITITPTEGYEVTKIKYTETPASLTFVELEVSYNNEQGTYSATFNMPDSSIYYSVEFALKGAATYNVECSVKDNVGGTISAEPNTDVAENATVQVTVTPDDGYRLKSLTMSKADGSYPQQIEGGYTFTMPAYDVKLAAEFEQDAVVPPAEQYSVSAHVHGDGGSIMQDNRLYAKGEKVTLSVTADKGYELDQLFYYNADSYVTTNPVSIDKTTKSFVMPDYDVKVIATFKPIENYEYAINVDVSGNCQVSRPTKAAPGELVEISINVDNGYHLMYVKVDGDYVTDSLYWADGKWNYSFYMPWHNVDIYVATTDKLFVNTVYDINGGAVEVWVKDSVSDKWDSTIFADTGDWVCFKATPYSGYEVGDISVTGRWSGNAYDAYYNRYDGCYYFKMPYESVNLSVSFVDNSHKVTVKDVTNGSLSVNTKWAVEDERVYITAVPDKGYELTWLYVKAADGSSVKVYEAIKEDTYYFFMPDQEVTVSAIFAYDYPDMPFIDVNPNSWYYSAIEFVYNKGIMNGVTASSFNPDSTITRGMIVTMLWRMAGEPSAVSAGFADVAADSYYAKAIAWAAKNGIIEGYSASSFGPNDAITREQLATVLYRYAKYLGYTTTGSSLSGYYDASRVSSWAKDAMGWAVKNGVVTGLSSTWLNPNGTASRAEAAQMFMNFYEFLG